MQGEDRPNQELSIDVQYSITHPTIHETLPLSQRWAKTLKKVLREKPQSFLGSRSQKCLNS